MGVSEIKSVLPLRNDINKKRFAGIFNKMTSAGEIRFVNSNF